MNNTHYTDYTVQEAYPQGPPPTYEEATRGDPPTPLRRSRDEDVVRFGPMQIWRAPQRHEEGFRHPITRRGAIRVRSEGSPSTSTANTSTSASGSGSNVHIVPPRVGTAAGPQYMYVPPGKAANLQFLPDPAQPGGRNVVVVDGASITPGVDFTKVMFHATGAISYPMQAH